MDTFPKRHFLSSDECYLKPHYRVSIASFRTFWKSLFSFIKILLGWVYFLWNATAIMRLSGVTHTSRLGLFTDSRWLTSGTRHAIAPWYLRLVLNQTQTIFLNDRIKLLPSKVFCITTSWFKHDSTFFITSRINLVIILYYL